MEIYFVDLEMFMICFEGWRKSIAIIGVWDYGLPYWMYKFYRSLSNVFCVMFLCSVVSCLSVRWLSETMNVQRAYAVLSGRDENNLLEVLSDPRAFSSLSEMVYLGAAEADQPHQPVMLIIVFRIVLRCCE